MRCLLLHFFSFLSSVVRMTLEVFEKNVTEESIADVVSLFPPGGVPKEVTEVRR